MLPVTLSELANILPIAEISLPVAMVPLVEIFPVTVTEPVIRVLAKYTLPPALMIP